jgi:hypothetical protein
MARDPHVDALLEKAWRELVRLSPMELAIQLATRDLINEGRGMVRAALADGLADNEVVTTVVAALLTHTSDPDRMARSIRHERKDPTN